MEKNKIEITFKEVTLNFKKSQIFNILYLTMNLFPMYLN